MIVNSNKLKTLISGLWILSFFIFVSVSSCSTPSKKEAESTDKIEYRIEVETTSTDSTEHPSENGGEHPSDSLSTETSGSEHPSDDSSDSEHPQ
jgi:hypothetical protein